MFICMRQMRCLSASPSEMIVSVFEKIFMLICMQKVNFISHFFLKILQRNSKLVILGNLSMPGYTHLNWQYQFEEIFDAYYKQKIKFILPVFLEIFQIYCKLVILSTLDKPGYTKWYYYLVENFRIYLQIKEQLHPTWFSGDIAKICKLLILGTLGMSGYAHPKW